MVSNTPPQGLNLPHRFRESSFRTYEPFIRTIVNSFPGVSVFVPDVSITTFSCRLRDAMKSLATNRWKTYVDIDRFDEIYPSLVVAERDNNVVVGPRDGVRQWQATNVGICVTSEPFDVRTNNIVEIELIGQLAHYKVFNRPIRLVNLANAALTAEQITSRYDVLATVENDTLTII